MAFEKVGKVLLNKPASKLSDPLLSISVVASCNEYISQFLNYSENKALAVSYSSGKIIIKVSHSVVAGDLKFKDDLLRKYLIEKFNLPRLVIRYKIGL